jgi:hypothetical protein
LGDGIFYKNLYTLCTNFIPKEISLHEYNANFTEELYKKLESIYAKIKEGKNIETIKELLSFKFKDNDNYFDRENIKNRAILKLINQEDIKNAPLDVIKRWSELLSD